MLSESAFVEFWGRLKKHASTTPAPSGAEKERTQRSSREEEDEDEEAEGTTLVEMASKVDLREIESVLRNDARFRAWRHKPEVREVDSGASGTSRCPGQECTSLEARSSSMPTASLISATCHKTKCGSTNVLHCHRKSTRLSNQSNSSAAPFGPRRSASPTARPTGIIARPHRQQPLLDRRKRASFKSISSNVSSIECKLNGTRLVPCACLRCSLRRARRA